MSPAARAYLAAAALLGLAFLAMRLVPPAGGAGRGGAPAVRPAEFVTDLALSEETADRAGSDVKATLLKGLRDGDAALAASGLADDFAGRFPEPEAGTERGSAGFRIREYVPSEGPELGREAFVAVLRRHAAGWVMVERTTWRMFEFMLHPDRRRAWIAVHFQIAGPRADGTRADVQATLHGEVALGGSGWRIRRLDLVEGFRIEAAAAPFVEITGAAGFTWNESDRNRRLFQDIVNARGPIPSGGLTAVDWDRDGHWDILATLMGKMAVLFRNDGRGGFVRAPLPFARPEECGFAAAVADLDGDGQEELVTGQTLRYEGDRAFAGIYTRRGGEWTLLPDALSFRCGEGVRGITTYVVLPHDVDGDGDLDLYFGNYADSRSFKQDFSLLDARDGAADALFINQGGLRFTEESRPRGLVESRYTLAAAFFDFDGDGDPDLLQATDYGPNIYWRNDGGGRFEAVAGHPMARAAYSMGIAIADPENAGSWWVHVSNMYSHAGNRIVPLATGLAPATRDAALVIAEGDWLFERDPAGGAWTQTAAARGVALGDWAWGAAFWDPDNDGDRDLFVTNGYTSHEDRKAPDY